MDQVQTAEVPFAVGNVKVISGRCKACDRVPTRIDGQRVRLHKTGFCESCRKSTVDGQEAMRIYDYERAVQLREKYKNAGTYDEYKKKNNTANRKRRRTLKKDDPQLYKKLVLAPSIERRANLRANDPITYQRILDQQKQTNHRLKNENDAKWIDYINLNRSRCTKEGCDCAIPCCIQFNHIDPTKKKFTLDVGTFKRHKQGTTEEWKAEKEKVAALCAFHHVDVTWSHTPESVDAKPSGSRCANRILAKQFKLTAKNCAACGKRLQLSSPGLVEPAELAKFHVDHISRATKTARKKRKDSLNATDTGLQLLCAHCHYMKTTGERYNMFETLLSTYLWKHVPLWFQNWFEINTIQENWKQRLEDWMTKSKEGSDKAAKRRKFKKKQKDGCEETENPLEYGLIEDVEDDSVFSLDELVDLSDLSSADESYDSSHTTALERRRIDLSDSSNPSKETLNPKQLSQLCFVSLSKV